MIYRLIVDPLANIDIIDAIEWYNNIQLGLGIKFYKQIQRVFASISKNLAAHSIRYEFCRTAIVQKFPYMVHYFVDIEKNTVVVISVLHMSRNPQMWDERTSF